MTRTFRPSSRDVDSFDEFIRRSVDVAPVSRDRVDAVIARAMVASWSTRPGDAARPTRRRDHASGLWNGIAARLGGLIRPWPTPFLASQGLVAVLGALVGWLVRPDEGLARVADLMGPDAVTWTLFQ